MTKFSNETLTQLLKDIQKDVNEGFKGVHDRQDKTNGNVAKNTAYRHYTKGAIAIIIFAMGLLNWEKIKEVIF